MEYPVFCDACMALEFSLASIDQSPMPMRECRRPPRSPVPAAGRRSRRVRPSAARASAEKGRFGSGANEEMAPPPLSLGNTAGRRRAADGAPPGRAPRTRWASRDPTGSRRRPSRAPWGACVQGGLVGRSSEGAGMSPIVGTRAVDERRSKQRDKPAARLKPASTDSIEAVHSYAESPPVRTRRGADTIAKD